MLFFFSIEFIETISTVRSLHWFGLGYSAHDVSLLEMRGSAHSCTFFLCLTERDFCGPHGFFFPVGGLIHTTCRCWRVRDCKFDVSNASPLSEQIEVLTVFWFIYIEWWTRSNPVGGSMET